VTAETYENVVATAVNGRIVRSGERFNKLKKDIPQAWQFFRGSNDDWAAFIVAGDHISSVDQIGVSAAHTHGIKPVLMLCNYDAVKAVSPNYRTLKPYLIYEIAGVPCLIPPLTIPTSAKSISHATTRIPIEIIHNLALDSSLPTGLINSLKSLERKYKRLKGDANHDDREEALLMKFAKRILEGMGLKPDRVSATQMIRTIEKAGLGPGRDHFFHSFQNYFLGLSAVSQLSDEFAAYKGLAKLNWEVEPTDVWFLTVIWHDAGYALQKFDNLFYASVGGEDEDDVGLKEVAIQRILERATTKQALRNISSLVARLLGPGTARTQFMLPRESTNIGDRARLVQTALVNNVISSHGAYGAIRLYCDYCKDLDDLEPEKGDLLQQTVLLAAASMPFHDWFFRKDVRDACGNCRILTRVLPFAALLAFIDSVQDDRRDLDGIEDTVLVLEKLLIEEPATVFADINAGALDDVKVLGKILEGRDVIASFEQTSDTLFFKYPQWVAGQT
jgi:hypothetical protein